MLDLLDTAHRHKAWRDPPPQFALLVGDQIYAEDNADLFDTSTPRERVFERYRRALGTTEQGRELTRGSAYQSRLMRSLPIYMAPDDHEMYDNFNGVRSLPRPTRRRVLWCAHAYDAFQAAHGYALRARDQDRHAGVGWAMAGTRRVSPAPERAAQVRGFGERFDAHAAKNCASVTDALAPPDVGLPPAPGRLPYPIDLRPRPKAFAHELEGGFAGTRAGVSLDMNPQ